MTHLQLTTAQLLAEAATLRQRIAELEAVVVQCQQAPAALQQSETRYRRLFETAQDGILILDADTGFITDVNPFLAKLLGYSHAELLGQQLWEIGPFKNIAAARASFSELQSTGYIRYEDLPLEASDGRRLNVEFISNVYWVDQQRVIQCNIRDITDRKRAEKALRESEARFRDMAEQVIDVLFVTDLSGLITYISPSVARVFGWQPAEMIGRNFVEFIAASETPRAQAQFRDSIGLGYPTQHLEMNLTHRDGHSFAGELNAAMLIKDDRTAGLIGLIRDITLRKQADETLQVQSAALNAAANAIVITDRERHIQWINPAFTTLTGYTAREAIGRDVRELVRSGIYDPAFYAGHDQLIDAGQSWHGEIVNRHKDGTFYTEEQTITPVLATNGAISHIIAIKQDISDRKQRESELEALALTATALRVASTRAEMLPVIVQQTSSMLGADTTTLVTLDVATGEASIAGGQDLSADCIGQRIPADADWLDRAISTKRPYVNNAAQHEPCLVLGEARAIAWVPLIAHDQVIGALGIGRRAAITDEDVRLLAALGDIAANALQRAEMVETLEQRVAERTHELAIANERLQELDRLKSKFVSDVSHELRTPITSLSLYIDLLECGKPEKREFYGTQLKQQMARLRALIDEILDLSHLERDQREAIPTPIDLNAVVEHAVAAQQVAAETAGLRLTSEVAAQTLMVLSLPDQLSRAITNLVANAIKYTPAGTVQVQTAALNGHGSVTVTDTGIGITPDDLPHVFDRFYRGQQVAQLNIPGTGLGLAIVKEIVEAHGGTVEVESTLGVGTTVRLRLRRYRIEPAIETSNPIW